MEKIRSRWLVIKRAQDGVTLVEVLVGVAITGMISTVVGSLLFATITSSRSLQQQTDAYESLRLPATMLMQDGRFAVTAACDWDYLRLYTTTTAGDYIQYQFASWGGIADPANLHRWVVREGVFQRDDVVGWNLVKPDVSPRTDATTFHRNPDESDGPCGAIKLVKAPSLGQSVNLHYYARIFMRNN